MRRLKDAARGGSRTEIKAGVSVKGALEVEGKALRRAQAGFRERRVEIQGRAVGVGSANSTEARL